MRLVCPNCAAQYEVADSAIPETGREVQCSDCGHCWTQRRGPAAPAATLATARPAPVQPRTTRPEPVPPAMAQAPADDTAPGPAAAPAMTPPRRPLDEQVMAILREEALREAAARREEAARPPLPAPVPPPAAPVPAPASAAMALSASLPQMATPRPAAPAPRAPVPDAGRISASLGPGGPAPVAEPVPAAQDSRPGFRAGFFAMLALIGVAAAAYAYAPRIAAMVPESAGAMSAYVATVDDLRRDLDATVDGAQARVEALLLPDG